MDVAVQPSAPEYACPMKIIEYMAMARCVVAPDQPNIREVIDDGRNGLLFTAADKNALEVVLLRAIGDSAPRRALGKNALETVFSRGFLWATNAERAVLLAREAGRSR
jgi:glycosyltransferase involved in cell wall biosynthesis